MLRDDIIEYSLDAHHSEEAGKKLRKKIWMVTIILTLITALEVIIGASIHQDSNYWTFVKIGFIALTLIKAGYIVLIFMHLGDERKMLKYFVLVPYFMFVLYFIGIMIYEGLAVGEAFP